MAEVLTIRTKEDLDHYLKKYNCETQEQLDEVLWFEYGVALNVKIPNSKHSFYDIPSSDS